MNGYCKATFYSRNPGDKLSGKNQEGLFEDNVFKKGEKKYIKNYNPNVHICSKKMNFDKYLIRDKMYDRICDFWNK